MKSIIELKNIYKDKDIWILASGPSMNHIEKSFFKNKITIGVNRICKYFDCNYIVAKDSRGFEEILKNKEENTKIILSKYQGGNFEEKLNKMDLDHYIFSHPAQKKNYEPDISIIEKDSDQIIVSFSTITSSIHIAAYMGAKNIIVCGHDCGTIDGYSTIKDYYEKINPVQVTEKGYVNWLKKIQEHTLLVNSAVRKEYSCNIYSLNPFINLNATGHIYLHSSKYFNKRYKFFDFKNYLSLVILLRDFVKFFDFRNYLSLVVYREFVKKVKNKIIKCFKN